MQTPDTEIILSVEQQIRALASVLNGLCPAGSYVEVAVRRYVEGGDIQFAVHGLKTYDEATEVCRALGVGDREKSIWNDHEPRTVLHGKIAPDIELTVYVSALPPTCHIEKYTERVPKKLVKEEETGEFIEIERTRVVCGEAKAQEVSVVA